MFKYLMIALIFSNFAFANMQKVVEVSNAEIGDLIQTVRLIGVVGSGNNINLIAQENGILEKIHTPSGTKVSQHQLVATLDNYQYFSEAEKIALSQLKSAENLYQKNAISKKDYDEKRKAYLNAQRDASRTSFRAPIAGVVGVFKSQVGDNVKAGSELVDIHAKGALHVDFSIPEDILPNIKIGQDVYIKSQKVILSNLQQALDPDTYMAGARVDFVCDTCIVGSYIDVDLVVQEHPKTIIIPFDAIFLEDGKDYVYVVEGAKVKKNLVALGLREKDQIEILSGVKENDQVVIRGQSRLSDGQEVKIHNIKG